MKTLLKSIFDELFIAQKVKNQTEFGKILEYDGGYISKLFRSKEELPLKVQLKLHDAFGITREYLSSNGKSGTMFAKDESTQQKAYDETKTDDTPITVNEEDVSLNYKKYTPMERNLMEELRFNSESMRMLAQALLNATETAKSQAHAIEMLSGKRSGEDQFPKSRAS